MMNVTLIAVGKIKEGYLRDGCNEYIKRLTPFARVKVIEINEERCGSNPTAGEVRAVIAAEGERILEKIPKGAVVIPLCIEGRQYTSPEISGLMGNISMSSSSICFVIGGSFGLGEAVKSKGAYKLSLGKITLPHQLARLVLLEQIYRAFSILNNSKYHK